MHLSALNRFLEKCAFLRQCNWVTDSIEQCRPQLSEISCFLRYNTRRFDVNCHHQSQKRKRKKKREVEKTIGETNSTAISRCNTSPWLLCPWIFFLTFAAFSLPYSALMCFFVLCAKAFCFLCQYRFEMLQKLDNSNRFQAKQWNYHVGIFKSYS